MAEEFTYPPYGIPLVDAFGGRFEAAYIVLHPFVQVPETLAWSVAHEYPADAQISAVGCKIRWAEVAAHTGLTACAHINQALLTSIGSLTGDLSDSAGRAVLQHFLQSQPVWMPVEGRFEPLLQPDFLATFQAAGFEEFTFVPEFPSADPTVSLRLDELRNNADLFPTRGTLVAPDNSFLFTVDWDSFFTLFYGSRSFIRRIAQARNLEGFFASPNTDHAWFNYSFGCATVTVSPEDWQTR